MIRFSRLDKLMRADTIEKILEMCDEFTPGETPEYFFDRNYKNAQEMLSNTNVTIQGA